jgi:predicted transcriptional regulator of viral defense system
MARAVRHESAAQHATRLIERKGGIIRTAEAMQMGIHPQVFYELRDSGVLEQMSRGVYRLAEQKPLSNLDLVTVAMRIPRAVICLVSALAFHGITTQIPHTVSIALNRSAESPKIEYPPVSVHRFSGESLTVGIEDHQIDGVTVHIYSKEKTLADCFKFRNKVGMDVVLEALKLYKDQGSFDIGKLLEYARICRVERIMKPYLEAML